MPWGVKRIDYYGLSYGTALGSVYAHLFPSHVRSMVLDGAVDANLSLITDATADAAAIQTALVHALNSCTALPSCPLGADPVSFYQSLQQRLVHSPLRAPGGGDTTPVTAGDLSTASLLYLSAPTFTPGYFPAVAAAAAGNGAPLRSVALGLEDDLNGASLVGPLWTITCNDAVDASRCKGDSGTGPIIGGARSAWRSGSRRQLSHRVSRVDRLERGHRASRTKWRADPSGDRERLRPQHPHVAAPQSLSAIGGRLVTYVGYGHTWLLNGSTNACMANLVTLYFVGGVVPAKGTCGPRRRDRSQMYMPPLTPIS